MSVLLTLNFYFNLGNGKQRTEEGISDHFLFPVAAFDLGLNQWN